jgi:hypothetical protein
MSNDPAQDAAAPPAAQAGQGQPLPAWAYVIGGASVVVAAEGLLTMVGNLANIGATALLEAHRGTNMQPSYGTPQSISVLIPMVFQPFLCALLIPAAILLLRRNRLAVRLHMVFAISTFVLASASALLVVVNTPVLYSDTYYIVYHLAGTIWAVTKSVIYPVFLFIWFRRRKVKADLAAW